MAISLDIFEDKDKEIITSTFVNPYKEVIERYEEFEKKVTIIPEDYIQKNTIKV